MTFGDAINLGLALAVVFAAGIGITDLLIGRNSGYSKLERWSLAWLFGTGAVSLMLWLAGFVVSGDVRLRIVVVLASSTVAYLGGKTARQRTPQIRGTRTIIDRTLFAIVLCEIVAVFVMSSRHGLGWDGLLNWEIKARYVFLNGGVMPAAYFGSVSRAFSHPEYPLFIPLTETWLYLWLGEANQFWAMTLFPVFYAAGAFLLAAITTRVSGSQRAGGLAAALLFFVPYLHTGGGRVISGYADFPLSICYLATVGYLASAARDNSAAAFRLFVASTALLPWMKREGLILCVTAAACAVILFWRRRPMRQWLFGFAPALVIAAAWRLYLYTMHVRPPLDFVSISFTSIAASSNRIGPIAAMTFRELASVSHWSVFWLLVLAALLISACRKPDRQTVALGFAIVAPLVLYCSTYLFSAWPSIAAHVTGSMPRLALQLVPVAWCLVAGILTRESQQPGPGR